jgi:hypothetical protein
MRQRIEDLGRIAVMIDQILDHEVFGIYQGRNKDFTDFISGMPPEKSDDMLDKLIYGLSDIKEKLCDISSIAEGTDRLNEEPIGFNPL